MTTNVVFGQDKDPQDTNVWYSISWPTAVVAQLVGVTVGDPVPANLALGGGSYATPGDIPPGTPLTVANAQLYSMTADGTGQSSTGPANSVAFQLSGGVPETACAIRAQVILTDGSTVFRSAILTVTGR